MLEVEAFQRSGSSNSIDFNVDLRFEKVLDLIKRHAGVDSLEGTIEMSKARMAFAVANGQEHRNSILAHGKGRLWLQDMCLGIRSLIW